GQQPQVINGASDFLGDALGDAGKHSRSAVSAASLPFGVAVEIEGIFEIK
ncbi:MAG: RidA family protein, partial [Pseudomonadota bacterium]